MCRSIKTLHNFKPPATDEEIRASSLQFVRKLSGFTRPSKVNELTFARAVDQVAERPISFWTLSSPTPRLAIEKSKLRRSARGRRPASALRVRNALSSPRLERTGGNDLVTAGRYGSLLASAPPRAA